jgi:hypothetical protein
MNSQRGLSIGDCRALAAAWPASRYCCLVTSRRYISLLPKAMRILTQMDLTRCSTRYGGTERLEIVHDGCEATRVEQAGHVAQSELALNHLRVCYQDLDEKKRLLRRTSRKMELRAL